MKKAIIAATLVSLLSGCATKNIPLTTNVGSAYRGKTITYSVHETCDFTAFTADKAMFGAIGGVTAVSKGNKLISENQISDPSATIGATLVNDLASKYGLIVKQPTKRTSSKKTEQIAQDYRDADLVLDVQTRNWGFFYFPTDWSHYYIMYSAKLQLIDTKQSKALASGSFSYDSKDNSKYPSYGQLTNNNAEGLKQEIIKARDQCIIESRQRIFNAR